MAIQPPGSYPQGNKKGKAKKKTGQEVFGKKEWYTLRSPSIFPNNINGKTLVTKSAGKHSYLSTIGRRYEVNQGDLTGSNDVTHRKFIFKVGEVKGNECVGFFDGMVLTSDKQRAMIKKWHTLIEAQRDIVAKDGSVFRVFVMAVTKRLADHVKKTCYAKHSEVKRIRKTMFEVIDEELAGCDVPRIMKKLSNETVGKEIEKRGSEVFPLQNCCVRKVKTIRSHQVTSNAGQQEVMEVEN